MPPGLLCIVGEQIFFHEDILERSGINPNFLRAFIPVRFLININYVKKKPHFHLVIYVISTDFTEEIITCLAIYARVQNYHIHRKTVTFKLEKIRTLFSQNLRKASRTAISAKTNLSRTCSWRSGSTSNQTVLFQSTMTRFQRKEYQSKSFSIILHWERNKKIAFFSSHPTARYPNRLFSEVQRFQAQD